MGIRRLCAYLAWHYGWTPTEVDDVTWDDALDYSGAAQDFERDHYKMLLAISTNPHLTPANKQRELWNDLKRGGGKVLVPKTEEEIKALIEGGDDGV